MIRVLSAAALAALPPGQVAAATNSSPHVILVDVSKTVGTLKALRGVNGAPDMRFAGEAGAHAHQLPRPLDLAAAYRLAAINLVRTHDSLAANIDSTQGSLPSIFPPGVRPGGAGAVPVSAFLIFPDPTADPEDPRNYNFGPTDELVKGIRDIGADVVFRLGRDGGTTAPPPHDLARYADIIRHIVLHYNKGWDHGLQSSIHYFEVWNEPDLGKIWWRGSPDEYYHLYEAASKAVKSADAGALVGGPAIAMVNASSPYREGFLEFAEKQRLPLDFFSWHYYSEANDPFDFVRIARTMRSLLDAHGYAHTLSSLDEWNAALGPARLTDADHAAFLTSALIYMEHAPVDQEEFYRADGEFGADGSSPSKVGQALIAWGKLEATPLRLKASGGDDKGFAVLGAKSRDGRTVQILVSNYEIPADQRGPRPGGDVWDEHGLFKMALLPRRSVTYPHSGAYSLRVTGLRQGRSYTVERFGLSSANVWKLVETRSFSGPRLSLSAPLQSPSVELIVIKADAPGKSTSRGKTE